MKKTLVVFLCACALYTSFWLFRAYHLKKTIAQQLQVLEYSKMHCSGFPFSVDVHLTDPKCKSLFQLEGNLTLGTSVFARKGWVKASGNGKAAILGKEITFSGTFGCKHHNLWQLIRNKSLLSQPIHKNLSKLLPKLTLFSDSLAVKYQGQSLSADRIFSQSQFDREGGLLRVNIKGAQTSLEALRKYYFNEKCDLRFNLIFKDYIPDIEIQDLCVEDQYFRHQFSGVIKNLSRSEGDLAFEFSQAVKKEYHPNLQKEHLSRIAGGIGAAFPERRLFGRICGSGDLHFTYDELKNWAIELQKCSWKFGRYRMDLAGKVDKHKALLDIDFHYYPELKLFIAKKLERVSQLFALIESQGSLEEQTNTLSLQLQFEGPTGWRIGQLPILEIASLL